MSGNVWSKFYWSDWEADPALRLCSLSAQGLWMRMLCIAAAHDPIGYVAVAGRGLDETSIARMTGVVGSEARDLLGELERNGVFSRDRQGRIYSRRMVSDAKKAAIAKKNGKRGGNPNLSKTTENSPSDNPQDMSWDNTQEPEANYQIETPTPSGGEKKSRRSPRKAIPQGFPGDAEIASEQQKAREAGADLDLRLEAEKFRNHALSVDRRASDWNAAWRNWAVKAVGWAPKRAVVAPPPADEDLWPTRIKRFAQVNYWNDLDWGPRPGKPGCKVPPETLMANGFIPPPRPSPAQTEEVA